MRVVVTFSFAVIAVAGVACAGSDADGTRERCIEARAAIVETRMAPQLAAASPELQPELEKHRTTMERALGDEFIERCLARAPSYAACLIRATDAEQSRRCDPDYQPAP